MSTTQARPLDWFHLGVKGVIEGDPDGFFHGDTTITGDASGGTSKHQFHYGNVTELASKPVDVLMRLNWLSVQNMSASAGANFYCEFGKTLPWAGSADRQLIHRPTIPLRDGLQIDFRGGLWTMIQKQDAEYLLFTVDNQNAESLHILLSGYFWYMGRLRRRSSA